MFDSGACTNTQKDSGGLTFISMLTSSLSFAWRGSSSATCRMRSARRLTWPAVLAWRYWRRTWKHSESPAPFWTCSATSDLPTTRPSVFWTTCCSRTHRLGHIQAGVGGGDPVEKPVRGPIGDLQVHGIEVGHHSPDQGLCARLRVLLSLGGGSRWRCGGYFQWGRTPLSGKGCEEELYRVCAVHRQVPSGADSAQPCLERHQVHAA